MEQQQSKSTKRKLKYQAKNVNKKELVIGSVIATLIAVTPYVSTVWESVPATKSWDTFFGVYTSNYYEDIQVLTWTLLGKIIPLLLLLVWMFTCRHWWYHIILVPIAMYLYQIIEIFNDDLRFTEVNQIFYLLPVMAVMIPSIYLIRARIFNKINEANKTLEELEEEFKLSPKNFWETIKQYF
ncbi:hypothetical protein [Snuella lapsa]|uniref:Uncharacterized protein n=1 Tax=Snuella lapsa TaxID=870481 RepID=A0ABP6YDM0_9FLAO